MDKALDSQVRHLYEVEGLSMRQIARELRISRKRVSRIIKGNQWVRPSSDPILKPYERLIAEWYKDHPSLRATQVYGRLRTYGFSGSYPAVSKYTQRYRQRRTKSYHELTFLAGEEAQVDWMEWRLDSGIVYGFVFILAYSRYLYLRFYPKHSLEFFLHGHIEAYKEIEGVAHRNRYDNLRSVIISRRPELNFNAQFLDFSRHYGFSIHTCNPGKPNEKGRVERIIRDIKDFLRVNTFADIKELNKKGNLWRIERNRRVHRSTDKSPVDTLKKERLKSLPQIHYRPYRSIGGLISKTGFIEIDTNRYSVPTEYSGNACEILAYPECIEVIVRGKKVAAHSRVFERKQKIENPSHREKLINKTPNFKYQRIYQLMKHMDQAMSCFLIRAEEEGEEPLRVSYELFRLLKHASKDMLLSAVREANSMGVFKVRYINSLLHVPEDTRDNPVYPQDRRLLEINYEGRDLKEYDELS